MAGERRPLSLEGLVHAKGRSGDADDGHRQGDSPDEGRGRRECPRKLHDLVIMGNGQRSWNDIGLYLAPNVRRVVVGESPSGVAQLKPGDDGKADFLLRVESPLQDVGAVAIGHELDHPSRAKHR